LPDVIGLGEIMVQFNAVTPGPLRHVVYFEKHAAGAEADVTVCVRRQGLSSGFITRLGVDEFGMYLYNWLRGEGVDVSQIKFDPTAPPGFTLFKGASQSREGARSFIIEEDLLRANSVRKI